MVREQERPDFSIREDSDYEGSEPSMKQIILRHIRKIADICCQEFTGGYWQKKPVKTLGGVLFTEEYHEDVREAFCNAVDFLCDVVFPLGDETLRGFLTSHDTIDKEIDIKVKLTIKRKVFREINIMFNRLNFFQASAGANE